MDERAGSAIVVAPGGAAVLNETPVHALRPAALMPSPRRWRWRGGLRAAYASETGSGHAHNEDCCSHVPSAERPAFCGVADGVGGGAHGEIASSVLLTHCAQAPKETYSDPARLIDWLSRADAQVREAISRRTDQAGAATLAAAWFPTQSTAYLVNVGDCRAYQLKPHKQRYAIRQLTVDQTYASFAQQPPPNGRPEDPARMVGAGAVGIPPVVKAQIRESELLLLCSDGVHKFVSDEQIADVVSGGLSGGSSLETICDELVHAAKRNGSHDDASALLVMRRPWFTPRWAYGCALAAVLLLWFTLAQGDAGSEDSTSMASEVRLVQEMAARTWRGWVGAWK
jgi:protein phosphatase